MDGKQRWTIDTGAKTETIRFSKFSNVKTSEKGVLVADSAMNCDCKNGVLSRGIGCECVLDENDTKVWVNGEVCMASMAYLYVRNGSEYEKRMLCLEERGSLLLYMKEYNEFEKVESFENGSKMLSIVDENKNFQYVIYGKKGVSLFNEEDKRKDLEFCATAACVYNDRLFLAVPPFRILYSKPGHPDEFSEVLDESGEIFYFGGTGDEVIAMQALENCMYLFTAHGITRMRMKGAAREFVLEKVDYAGGEIFGNSVGLFGNRICFLASDGVYLFDGSRVKKGYEKLPIFPKRTGQVCSYSVFEGKYLLRYTDWNGDKMLVLDGDGENGYFSFIAEGLCALEGEALFKNRDELCRFSQSEMLPDGCHAVFTSEKLDFGGKTALKEICVTGEGSVTVIVTADGVQKTVKLTCEGGRAKSKLRCYGEEFVIALRLENADSKVRALDLIVEKIRG